MQTPHLKHLIAFFPNDTAMQREILTEFLLQTPFIIQQLKTAVLTKNAKMLQTLLHTFAPNLYYVGLTQSQALAQHYSHQLLTNPDIPEPIISQLCEDLLVALPQIIALRDTLI